MPNEAVSRGIGATGNSVPSRKVGIGSSRPSVSSQRHRDLHDDCDAEANKVAWLSSTGTAAEKQRRLLQKTKFVREGQSSRQWTGDWTREDGDKGQDNVESQEIRGVYDPPPIDVMDSRDEGTATVAAAAEPPVGESMASFYSRLAASMKPASDSPVRQALIPPTPPGALPSTPVPKVIARKKPSRDDADWFTNKAFATMTAAKNGPSLLPEQPLGNPTNPLPADRNESSPAHAPLEQISHPRTAACPTCGFFLPNPCPSGLLRSHLSSLAHRLALAPPSTSASAAQSKMAKSQDPSSSTLESKLHLDARNKGYVLLSGMGWSEGMGVGTEEWEWKRRNDELMGKRQRRLKKRKAASVGQGISEEEVEEVADVFDLPVHDKARRLDVNGGKEEVESQLSASESDEEAEEPSDEEAIERPKPRLQPVSVHVKHDRSGLGKVVRSTGKRANKAPSRVQDGSAQGGKKRRNLAEKQRRDRQEWLELRHSLN